MNFLVTFTNRLCQILCVIGAVAALAMMLHVSLDVALRNLFRISMNTTPDIVARYYMVAIAFMPLGWLQMRNGMITVELLDGLFTGWARRLIDCCVALLGAVVYGVIAYATFGKAMGEAASGTFVELVRFQMPVWHSYFLVPIGLGLASLACALTAITSLLDERTPG